MKNKATVMSQFTAMGLLMIFALGIAATGVAQANERYGKQKVVYHINTDVEATQAAALRNIQNHIDAVGAENLDLKVVLHGDGLSLLLDPDSLKEVSGFKHANATEVMTAKVDGLRNQGVKFNVCGITVKGRKVDLASDLHLVEPEDVVPSGVAEIAHLQAQGYVYIKP